MTTDQSEHLPVPAPTDGPEPEISITVAPVPAPQPHPLFAALFRSIDRLENIIDIETWALSHRGPLDLELTSRSKSQSLLELSRLMRALEGKPADPAFEERLGQLRAKLEKNRAALANHLRAAREISEIVAAAIREADSDGTYTAAAQFRGAP